MARLKGFEPLAYGLEVRCSILLSYRRTLERVMGIEPTRPAWKAGILPLNYTRNNHQQLKILTQVSTKVNIINFKFLGVLPELNQAQVRV